MSTSKDNLNWIEIDKIIWNIVQTWNGKEAQKKSIIQTVMKRFRWTESQTKKACEMHFNMYNRLKTK